jgi:hypothetical protein
MMSSSRLRNSGRKCARTTPITRSRTASTSWPSPLVAEVFAAEVRGHDDDRVAEVDRAALAVGQAPVVEHLQQHVEDVRMRLLDLVEQHDLVGPPPHRLGQRAALLVADIAGRRADQPGHRVLLHELGHVDAHHRGVVVEQERGERLGQLGLADAGRAQEHERADRPVRVLQPGAGAAHRGRDRAHRLGLADDALAELVLHAQQLVRSPSSILSTGTPVQRETTCAMWSGVTASSTMPRSRDRLLDLGLELLLELRDGP